MKLSWAYGTGFAVLLLLCGEATAACRPGTLYVDADALRMRDAPVTGKVVAALPRAAKVTVTGCDGDWSQISGEPELWVHSAYLSDVQPVHALIAAFIRDKMARCWNPPMSEDPAVKRKPLRVRVQLDREGRLKHPPQVINETAEPEISALAKSAVTALEKCGPFELPVEHYEVWKDLVLNFAPPSMF